ncbi:glycosyl transferase family 1 [filamentous cyanobacterium CCP2]|nr:glycosyl transferase family 1 [filamentous cyanobacterium CCP2]
MRLLSVQYAGCYKEAFYQLAQGEHEETYYAQKYSVDAVAGLKQYADEVATLSYLTNETYDEYLPNGVRAIGAGMRREVDFKEILRFIKSYNPTHLILRTPTTEVLKWAVQHQIPTIATLADSFQAKGLRHYLKNLQLAHLLNSKSVHWVGNHGVSASRSLQRIGVNPDKIIPWDWPHVITPSLFSAKTLRSDEQVNSQPWNMLFVGHLSEAKGVGDALRAIADLKQKGLAVNLKLAGKGSLEQFQLQAQQLGIANQVEFLGLVKNKEVVTLMRSADLVLIPSRHEYPEGFPMTIYEALCSRTPIVASDHPMFRERLQHLNNAMIFQAGNANALANCVEDILQSPHLYHSLSQASAEAWQRLQIPVQWGDFLNYWLQQSPESHNWLQEKTLASGLYNQPQQPQPAIDSSPVHADDAPDPSAEHAILPSL